MGREFEDGMESIWVTCSRLRKADSIDHLAGMVFQKARFSNLHIHNSFKNLSVPRCWDFSIGDRVFIVAPKRIPENPYEKLVSVSFVKHSPDETCRCEGSIVLISELTCQVKLDNIPDLPTTPKILPKLAGTSSNKPTAFDYQPLDSPTLYSDDGRSVLQKYNLRQSFKAGDLIKVADGLEVGWNGWVLNMKERQVNLLRPFQPLTKEAPRQITRTFGTLTAPDGVLASAGRVLDETHASSSTQAQLHPSEHERAPWIGTYVRIVKHKGGFKDSGIVKSVHIAPPVPWNQPNKTNNVSGLIIGIESDTRRQQTGDIVVDYNSKQQFCDFYFEQYPEKEQRELKERAKLKEIEERERDLLGTPIGDHGGVSNDSVWNPSHSLESLVGWLHSKAIYDGVNRMKALVDVLGGQFKGKNRYVELEFDGEDRPPKIIYYPPRIQKRDSAKPIELIDLQCSTNHPKLSTEARMMIATNGEHIGKLVYLVGQRYVSDVQTPENSHLILRVVADQDVDGHTCEISEEELEIHESSLAIVKDDGRLRSHEVQEADEVQNQPQQNTDEEQALARPISLNQPGSGGGGDNARKGEGKGEDLDQHNARGQEGGQEDHDEDEHKQDGGQDGDDEDQQEQEHKQREEDQDQDQQEGDQEEGDEAEHGEHKEEDMAGNGQLVDEDKEVEQALGVGPLDDSDDSGSNFSETQVKEKAQRRKKGVCSSSEEDSTEDDGSPPPPYPSAILKTKGKSHRSKFEQHIRPTTTSLPATTTSTDMDSTRPNSSDPTQADIITIDDNRGYRRGPMSAKCRGELDDLQAHIKAEIAWISKDYERSPETLYTYIYGNDVAEQRKMSIWNIVQSHASHYDPKPDDMTLKEWHTSVQVLYEQREEHAVRKLGVSKLSAEQLWEEFAEEINWYSGQQVAITNALLLDGSMTANIQTLLWPVLTFSHKPGQNNEMVIQDQLHDLEAMFRVIELQNAGTSKEHAKHLVLLDREKPGKDHNRKMIKVFTDADTKALIGKPIPIDSFIKVTWKYRLCIKGWPGDMTFPSTGCGSVYRMEAAPCDKVVRPQENYIRAVAEGKKDKPCVVKPNYFRTVRWDEDSMELSETNPRTKNIPIIIDDTGEVLHTAETSLNFGTEKFWDLLVKTKGGGKRKGGKQLKPTITINEAQERRIREMAHETLSSLRGIKEKEKELDDLRARSRLFSRRRMRRRKQERGEAVVITTAPLASKVVVLNKTRRLPRAQTKETTSPYRCQEGVRLLPLTAAPITLSGSSSRSSSTRTVMPMTAIRHKVVNNKCVQEDYSNSSYSQRQLESRRSVEEEYSHRTHNHHKRPCRDIEVESPEPRGQNWDNRESSRNPCKHIQRDESRSPGPSRGSTSLNRDSLDPGKGKGRDYGDAYNGDDAGYDEDYDGYNDGAPPPRYAPTHKSRVC
ncbi:hypothetical protein PQX77_020696 [Marasmius sp. AFHP31]|nr:hypothetical protein PQX77_020696 [Marasmius sp. AFHP31]